MAHNIITGTVTRRQDHTPFSTVARRFAKRAAIVAGLVFAAMLALGFVVQAVADDPGKKPLPACEYEGDTGCYWDADTMGNGRGTDYVDVGK